MRWSLKKVVAAVAVPSVCLSALWAAGPLIPLGGQIEGRGPAELATIALTFDDGPNPVTTPQVIDVLDRYDVRGTFFLVGANVERHEDVARLIVERGHQVGNHSEFHANLLPYYSPARIARDYEMTQAAIVRATGKAPRMYRAPHGRVSPWMRYAIRREGALMIGWDYSPRDWEHPPTDALVESVVSAARNGSIILLHDGLDLNDSPDNHGLVEALPGIIEGLRGRGFRLVTVEQMLDQAAYR